MCFVSPDSTVKGSRIPMRRILVVALAVIGSAAGVTWWLYAFNFIGSSLPRGELLAAPERLELDRWSLTLKGKFVCYESLWNTGRGVPVRAASPLFGKVEVCAAAGGAFPPWLVPSGLWVVGGWRVWECTGTPSTPRPGNPSIVDVWVAPGPHWDHGSEIDVVLRLRDERNGRSFLLRAPRAKIRSSD